MGKLTSIYLTPEEDEALRAYCDKHGCTPHSVIKTGLHWMLEEIKKNEDGDLIENKKAQDEKTSETRKTSSARAQVLKQLREGEKKE